ncbi:hypothetical protein BDB00DRAFT_60907 [Zychaea mexicana]|uniref:uncharacterized protein n=1 Tax=Zychaea mexicana TaxID=64656 RepID=UPI0022FE7E88|nr:uncharacterized protein BDB00DRAFT_60907 [Zychaea mexicana]KAI9488211.1 hypothetical protein BDB00DRAFT_60907 [Zychaea mexicana]
MEQQQQPLLPAPLISSTKDDSETTSLSSFLQTSNHAIDFVRCLPFELLPLVFDSFPIENLFECMNVSPSWRYRIARSPSLWQQVTVIGDATKHDLIPKLQQSSIAAYIRQYKIIDGSEKEYSQSADLIVSGCLTRLQSLAIHGGQQYCFYDDSNSNNILQSIQHLRNTLTELELTWYGRDLSSSHLPRLSSLLSGCPSLRRLRVDMPAIRANDGGDNEKETGDTLPLFLSSINDDEHGWKLTHLQWLIGSRKATAHEFASILDTCPALTYLKLDSCKEPTSFLSLLLDRKSPKTLRYLALSAEHNKSFENHYWNDDGNVGSEEARAVKQHQHCYNLKALAIPCLNEIDWINLTNFMMMMNRIQDLTILHGDHHAFDLARLLRVYHGKQLRLRHTGLRYQYISTIHARVSFNYSSQLNRQRKTTVITSTFCRDYMVQCPWFMNQLKSSSFAVSTLSLGFSQCFILDSCLRRLLDGFPCLQEIDIDNCVLESTTLTDLIDGLAAGSEDGCSSDEETITSQDNLQYHHRHLLSLPPPMKHISFGSIPGLTDSLVATLAEIHSLKQVTLSCCYSVTDQGVRDLVDKSGIELEQVVIRDCKQVSYMTTEYIQKKLESRSRKGLAYYYDACIL